MDEDQGCEELVVVEPETALDVNMLVLHKHTLGHQHFCLRTCMWTSKSATED